MLFRMLFGATPHSIALVPTIACHIYDPSRKRQDAEKRVRTFVAAVRKIVSMPKLMQGNRRKIRMDMNLMRKRIVAVAAENAVNKDRIHNQDHKSAKK